MNQDELIEKCRLTEGEIEGEIFRGIPRPRLPMTWFKYVAEAQLRKAIPIILALIEQEYEPVELEVLGKPSKIICLCGSTRFTPEMLVIQWNLTKQGHIVLSWCALPDNYVLGEDKAHIGDREGVKEVVDEVHKRKIDLCDEVFIINIGGYIGNSTTSEIKYAIAQGKPVKYLEPEWDYTINKGISQATIAKNQKGQLYRRRG